MEFFIESFDAEGYGASDSHSKNEDTTPSLQHRTPQSIPNYLWERTISNEVLPSQYTIPPCGSYQHPLDVNPNYRYQSIMPTGSVSTSSHQASRDPYTSAYPDTASLNGLYDTGIGQSFLESNNATYQAFPPQNSPEWNPAQHRNMASPYKPSHPTTTPEAIDSIGDIPDSVTDTDVDVDVVVGSVLKSRRLKCAKLTCGRTFGRMAELRRHYNGTHVKKRGPYWCEEPLCKRSKGLGHRSFHRKDKLKDHVRMVHGDEA